MTAAFIYTIISCALFWFIFSKKARAGTVTGYSPAELIPFYALMRLVPLFMLKDRPEKGFIALGADAVVLVLVWLLSRNAAGRNPKTAAALYLFCPLPVSAVITGSVPLMIISGAAALAAVVTVCLTVKKYSFVSPLVLTGAYITLSTGAYLTAYGLFARGDRFSELLRHEYSPSFLTAGLAVIIAGLVMTGVKLFRISKQKSADIPAGKAPAEPFTYEPEKFGMKNIIHIIVLTAVYAAVVFFRIGSHEAPETGQRFRNTDPDNSEIIIDLGDYITASKLDIFLGQESLRTINVSAFNESTGEWELIKTQELQTAFAWNTVDLNWTLRYIGIVFSSEDTHFNEIVITDSSGNRITPVNASERPYLYDEQELYPEVPTYYYRMMFDEIYHGRTGYEFLHNLLIYETTHPPFGKTLISLGIAAFGMNPFGWRFTVAVCGTLLVPLMYLFAWLLSRRSATALTGGLLMATEFMHFTLSRIATIDIIVALFIVMMFFFMYGFVTEMNRDGKFSKQLLWLVLSGISMGLACATKWTGIYAAGGIAVIFFTFLAKHCASKGSFRKSLPYLLKLCVVCVVSFLAVPFAVYTASYFEWHQVWPDKTAFKHMTENAVAMFSYHSEVTASHPYESPWYDWLTDKQPLLDAINVFDNGKVSSIATFINPVVAFGGLAALVHNIYLWRVKKNVTGQFLAIAYISMLMPWFFIHRTVFIYQYFGCVLVMILLICNSLLNSGTKIRRNEKIAVCVSFALFIIFFPQISGIEVKREYIKQVLELVPTWIFE